MKHRKPFRTAAAFALTLTLAVSMGTGVLADEAIEADRPDETVIAAGPESLPDEEQPQEPEAAAEEEKQQDGSIAELPTLPAVRQLEEVEIPQTDAYDFTNEEDREQLMEEAESFPAKFDMRDMGWVTPVKLQNPFGSCWSFAAIASAETSLISSGLADASIDLSERHLSYFTRTSITDQTSSQYGEGYKDRGMSASEKLNTGGYSFLANTAMGSGIGPVIETDDPALMYRGYKGWIDQRYFGGDLQDFSYSSSDDWSIPNDRHLEYDYSLAESYVLPTPAKVINDNQYSYDGAATAAIKKELLAGRAVQIGFLADQSSPNQTEVEPIMMSSDWAQYGDFVNVANHAVTIVGWDDTIGSDESGVHFREDRQPQDYGAWLIKNSWGSGEEEFPNTGEGDWGIQVPKKDKNGNVVTDENGEPVMVGSGYFWLSYYDHSISYPASVRFLANDEDTVVDAYDFMNGDYLNAKEFKTETKMANDFAVLHNQILEQISFQTTHPYTTVKWQVYIMLSDSTSTDYAMLASEGEETFEFGGFHKVRLEKSVPVMSGQHYWIVITETIRNDQGEKMYTANLPVGNANDWNGVVNLGESMFYKDGSWMELSDAAEELLPDQNTSYDNFPIKGYSRLSDYNFDVSISGNNKLTHEFKESAALKVRTAVRGARPESLNFKWRVRDEEMIDVIPTEDTFGAKISIHKKEDDYADGETLLYLDAYDGNEYLGTSVAQLFVYRPVIEGLLPADTQSEDHKRAYEYTGKAQEPEVAVYDLSGYLCVEHRDYELVYTDNVKAGVAKVEALPKGASDPDSRASWFFAITPSKAELNKLTAGEEKLTVAFKDQSSTGITGYRVEYRQAGTTGWKSKKVKPGKTELTITGLTPGAKYEVRVCGVLDVEDTLEYYGFIDDHYDGEYSGVLVSDAILKKKAAQPMTVSTADRKIKYSDLKKANKTVKAITVKNNQGKVTYKKVKVNKAAYEKNFTVNTSTGKITVKKGTPKGTYKIKVKVSAAGNDDYKAGSKNCTVVIIVK